MKKLIQGIISFRKGLTEEHRRLFAKLALGQKPDALFIACSDSRVVPNLFASTDPGDLFVLRCIGNFVPPYSAAAEDVSAAAAIEYALLQLNVAHIVVCGHSECGAIQALVEGTKLECCHFVPQLLKFGAEALDFIKEGKTLDASLSTCNQVSQANVLLQIKHLLSYPCVQKRVNDGSLSLHGWWFDIAQADVYCYEESQKKFVLLDEKEALLMLSRLA